MTTPINSTLADIRTKVRRLTASPSALQLTDNIIDRAVNDFYIYDFPAHLKNENLRETYEFYTTANVDVYDFPYEVYRTVEQPIYIAGYQSFYTQDQSQFYASYPKLEFLEQISSGNATAGPYTGNASNTPFLRGFERNPDQLYQVPISNITQANPGLVTTSIPHGFANLQQVTIQGVNGMVQVNGNTYTITVVSQTQFFLNEDTTAFGAYINGGTAFLRNIVSRVLLSAEDASGASLVLRDDGAGNLFGNGSGTVNYLTGAVSATFSNPIPASNEINLQTIPYVAARPLAALFYDAQFILRPVPDQAYKVQINAYRAPSALLDSSNTPQLREWWQLIAFGAAKKILEDRRDTISLQQIFPAFQEQMLLANRRTIVQNSQERAATIYSEQVQFPYGNFYNGYGF